MKKLKNKNENLSKKDSISEVKELPPGAYIIINGKLEPDLNDEAMAERLKIKKNKNEVNLSEFENKEDKIGDDENVNT